MHLHLVSRIVPFLALSLACAGCGGGSTTAANGPTAAPPLHAERHERRRHRHRHADASYGDYGGSATPGATAIGGSSWACDDQHFLSVRSQSASGSNGGDQEVDVCGTVLDVRASRTTRSGLHGYFDLQVAPGTSVEIVSDLGEMDAPSWPWVKTGDYAYVQGRYYYDNAASQGIDWTHHGTSRSWPTAGYVVVDGKEYQ